MIRDLIISWSVGLLFGCGLLVSGMCRRINILAFLWAGQDWNPSLLFVLTPGLLVGLITFNYMLRVRKNPYYGERLFNPSGDIDWKLIVGALMFGLGWGIGGICPGPAIVLFPVWTVPIHLIWFTCVLIGMAIGSRVKKCCKGVDEVSDV